jgi:topoisomerase IA-like protein
MPMKKLKALDTLHVSNVKADPIRPGEEFEVEPGAAKSLIERGLAKEVRAPAKKKAASPANKAAATPANKAAGAAAAKPAEGGEKK